jgi:heterodisulfide reductase subunit C
MEVRHEQYATISSRRRLPVNTQKSFIEEVMSATPGETHLDRCIQCGTCGGSCPSGGEMDHTPRALFAMIRADMREEVYQSNTPWYCVSCYYCTVRCPQEVKITDLMYTLKSLSKKRGSAGITPFADFSSTFNDYVINFGRAFEFGLATRFMIKHLDFRDVPGLAGMGIDMVTKQKMGLIPKRINDLDGLKKILKRADEIEEASQ